jgi:hypothetical protein
MRGKNELEQKKSIKRGVAVEVVATAISRSKKKLAPQIFCTYQREQTKIIALMPILVLLGTLRRAIADSHCNSSGTCFKS